MRVMIELDLPDGQSIPSVEDIKRLTSPDWHADWWSYEDAMSQNEDLTEDEAREVLECMLSIPTLALVLVGILSQYGAIGLSTRGKKNDIYR